MSFFGFNTTLPRDQAHPSHAPGFGQNPDPFAGLGRPAANRNIEDDEDDDDGDALDFEETYDGLGDQLDETDDTFNDETFGGESKGQAGPKPVGKDFDFFGQTAQVSNAINEEQLLYNREQSSKPTAPTSSAFGDTSKPTRTGYEKYQDPTYIPDLQANASLWGVAAKKPSNDGGPPHQRNQSQVSAPSRKMMSLEEVEASMRSQNKKPATPQNSSSQSRTAPQYTQPSQILQRPSPQPPQPLHVEHPPAQHPGFAPPEALWQQPPQGLGYGPMHHDPAITNFRQQEPPRILQRDSQPIASTPHEASQKPRQILQNPNRRTEHSRQLSAGLNLQLQQPQGRPPPVQPGTLPQAPHVTHPSQLAQLPEDVRRAYVEEQAKQAKRNHKIFLLSKDNGLMTPQDKNFIVRIQLQQLVSATGNPNEQGTDAALVEDFYYQVHSQIRGGPRQTPHQPLNPFAQTYLFQTGGRQGAGAARRFNRTGETHMQRMEQQVQRAVEAAKNRPKNSQLVIEGSLGKISFSNAKTPKPLLNLKRGDSSDGIKRPHSVSKGASERKVQQTSISSSDRKSVLRSIEKVYSTLMQLEDHERHIPSSLEDDSSPDEVMAQEGWRHDMRRLNEKLWRDLKVMDPIVKNSTAPHPFIAFFSFAKGKRALPRIFRHIDQEQRVTILTMIVVHIGVLDVVRLAQLQSGEYQLPSAVREEVELFSQAVMPSLFGYVNEAPLNIVVGLLGILLDSVKDIAVVARTKVGLGILTMFLSRAELLKQAGDVDEQEWQQWTNLYNRLFDALEPVLGQIFPSSINSGEDMYVWQFLAAMGLSATPDQHQRLVMAVKDRVMETVVQSKTLPAEMSSQRLANVNLFMRAIGLDVELLKQI